MTQDKSLSRRSRCTPGYFLIVFFGVGSIVSVASVPDLENTIVLSLPRVSEKYASYGFLASRIVGEVHEHQSRDKLNAEATEK